MKKRGALQGDNLSMRRSWLVLAVVLSGCPIVVPGPAHDANALCAQLIAANDLSSAETACDHALEYQPKYWDALHNKGLIAQMRGQRDVAKKFYIEALRTNQAMKQSHNAIAALAMDEGDLDYAIDHFRAALRLDPQYIEARRNLGAALLRKKDYVEAEKAFRQFILVNGDISEAWIGFGVALNAQGKRDDAANAFEKATILDVGDDRAWLLRGLNELERSRIEEAKECFERCLLANEKNLECQQRLESTRR